MEWKPAAFQVPATLSENIYQALKKALIEGEIKPGQRLQEKEIAALFNTSSTPVREAFFRLAAEKYLVINARKEVLAQDTTLEQVRELYEIVRTLDILAAREPCPDDRSRRPGDPGDDRALGRSYDADDHRSYLEQNLRIHDRIWRCCGSAALYETLRELMSKIGIYHRKTDFAPFADSPVPRKVIRRPSRDPAADRGPGPDGPGETDRSPLGEEFSVDNGPASR